MSDRLHYSPQIQLDLDEIVDYFERQFGNRSKGIETARQILESAQKIPGRATRFPPVGPLPFTTDEYRFVQVGSYVIFFRAVGEDIYVDRVLNNRRNFAALLGLV